MIGVILAALVIVLIAYLVYKKYKPQTVILSGGMLLIAGAIMIGNPIIAAKQSTGNVWLDMFKLIEDLASNRVAGLGLMIMSVSGFVKYMDHIGASKAFVHIGVKPLQFIRSPYVVLSFAYLIGQMMKMAITSAAGLGVLLMATMFPIYRRSDYTDRLRDAAVFSFAGLAPVIAAHHDVNPVEMLIPMQFSATLVRSVSPISAVMIAVAGIAAISPFDIAKRTALPLGAGLIVTTIASLMLI